MNTPPATASTRPRAVPAQYFLSFGVLGAIWPFLSVLLDERGLSHAQIGNVLAVSSLGVIFTPIIITLLADTAIAARFLMVAVFIVAGFFMCWLIGANTYWPILALFSLHAFSLQPAFPLQDGIHFAAQAARRQAGLPQRPYHTVRIWGTVGYIVPAIALLFFLGPGKSMTPVLVCAALFCLLGAANAFLLPHTPPVRVAQGSRCPGLPTLGAAKALLEPHVLVFCIAMFLIYLAMQTYYGFYPLHLTDRAGLDKRWVGLIANIGVVVEIFFMLGFGYMLRRLTLRRIMYLGAGAIALRYFLLAAFPNPYVAIGVQALHGMTVLVIHVAPPMFLDQRADDRYRNSIQGLYTMAFAGAGKVIGSWGAGWLAQKSLAGAFWWSGGVCVVAGLMFYFAFHERREKAAA